MSHQHLNGKPAGPIKPDTALHRLLQLLAQAIARSLTKVTGQNKSNIPAAQQHPPEAETASEDSLD